MRTANAALEILDIEGLEVAAWLPATMGKNPVVLFSHGFHGCNTQSKFLMESLAKAGYAVFAPNHKDAACRRSSKWFHRSEAPFKDADQWDDNSYVDRGNDMHKLLNALVRDIRFTELDWQHVGIAGHSLGGYTALAVAGAWPAWRDKRIKAVLALSPYSAPFIVQYTLQNINVPVMYQGGTRDAGITPFINKGDGAYDQTQKPKIYVELNGAGHFAWTDMRSTYHEIIDTYSIAFFDYALKGKPFPPELLNGHTQVSKVWAGM